MPLVASSPTGAKTIPIRNAWYLLLYAWDLAHWRDATRMAAEDAPTLLGLLARVLDESTRKLLRRQLGRAHQERTATIQGIRGRIDFGASLRGLHFERGQAVCKFPELSIDTPRNRILRSTIAQLATDPRVDAGNPSKGSELRGRLRQLGDQMAGVSLVRLSSSDFRRVQLGRSDRDYELPLTICALLHRLEIPTEAEGDHALTGLLRDEIEFPKLFECFVRNFYRMHLTDCSVGSEVLSWHDTLGSKLAPAMRTDITIEHLAAPEWRLVIDTKFSSTTLGENQYGAMHFKSGNLYQIYAYLRTQEDMSDRHRNAAGMLLYPTTSGQLDESMLVQGHRIRVATLDLSQVWKDIEARLVTLIDGFAHRPIEISSP
jgi:5-methylcytosine-specific restriction enzyme subunit McrC